MLRSAGLTDCDQAFHFEAERVIYTAYGSAKVTGGPPGLQIRCGGLVPSQVGSIPMHFRHLILST